ncbi:hypothetical protein BB559_005450 [Furculomyces boomerangus]|uniref:Anaphase-promoting complex subunit 11 n=2 Tax=Harpellales TaxID=61421 RepID=A0A2T9Y8R7_9FUNG|nr:hypothetical protein BB559_005450 [Furculomyces boomerangus]PWA01111.1 hypothetical protein BB558_002837 [Smittium angustum]
MKIIVKSITAHAKWAWKTTTNDICGICRLDFEACCPDCLYPGQTCQIVEGACGHIFHVHCIDKWLNSENSQNLCPMDRLAWKKLQ